MATARLATTSCFVVNTTQPAMTEVASNGVSECCYSAFLGCPGGRPIAIDGAARVASVVRRSDWG
jgi:hypothetical protein